MEARSARIPLHRSPFTDHRSPITKEGNYAGLEEDLRGHRVRCGVARQSRHQPRGPRLRRVAASSGWSTRPGCSWRRPAAKTVGARLSMHPAIPKRPAHPRPRRVAEDRTRVECSTRSFSERPSPRSFASLGERRFIAAGRYWKQSFADIAFRSGTSERGTRRGTRRGTTAFG